MNKKEMNTILNTYKEVYHAQTVLGFDHSDSIRTLKFMLDKLNLKKERYIIENQVICERDNIKPSMQEIYQMIFDDFLKHGRYVHYELSEIEQYYDDLQFEFTEELNNCHNARINYIMNFS